MKTIRIKNITLEEIIVRPNDDVAVSVVYRLVDDSDVMVAVRRAVMEKKDLTPQTVNFLDSFANKIKDALEIKEQLK